MGCVYMFMRRRTYCVVWVATLSCEGREAIDPLDRRASLAESFRRSEAGFLCRWHDRGTDHRTFPHSVAARHLAHVGDGIQGNAEAPARNRSRTLGRWHS